MPKTIRCPYCVEGDSFKAMMGRAEGRSFVCARCGHVAMPDDASYQCKCAKCAELDPEEGNS